MDFDLESKWQEEDEQIRREINPLLREVSNGELGAYSMEPKPSLKKKVDFSQSGSITKNSI